MPASRDKRLDAPLVIVRWRDSRQPDPKWVFLADRGKPRAVECVTVGWLIHDGMKAVSIAQSMGDLEDVSGLQVSGVMEIPTCAIQSMTQLAEDGVEFFPRTS